MARDSAALQASLPGSQQSAASRRQGVAMETFQMNCAVEQAVSPRGARQAFSIPTSNHSTEIHSVQTTSSDGGTLKEGAGQAGETQ
eukprot:4454205-Prymnesium_polylepis.1